MQSSRRIFAVLLLAAMIFAFASIGSAYEVKMLEFAVIIDNAAIENCAAGNSLLDEFIPMVRKYNLRPVVFINAEGLEYDSDLIFALSKLKIYGYEIYPAARNAESAEKFRLFMRHTVKRGTPFVLAFDEREDFTGLEKIKLKTTARFYDDFMSALGSAGTGCTGLMPSRENLYTLEIILGSCKAGESVPADIYTLAKAGK